MRFQAIGTRWIITSDHPLPRPLKESVRRRVEVFDAVYSRFRHDSLVSRIARARHGGTFRFPSDGPALFERYDRLAELTGGAVDPLVGCRLAALGYGPDYRLTPDVSAERLDLLQDRPRWGVDARHGGDLLTTEQPVVLDVGAVGKGYLVDLVSELLVGARVENFTVDAGGDLRHHGSRPLRVGLEDPRDHERLVGVIDLGPEQQTSALCASATDRRRWGPELHHVLDARTGLPTTGVTAAWGSADEAATADALATAVFFVPPERAASALGGTAARLLSGGRLERDGGWPGQFFTAPVGGPATATNLQDPGNLPV